MQIGGLQKSTLLDYPGKLACTVFTVGCNFRCPFCHNRSLINKEVFRKEKGKIISESEWWKFVESRKGILDGVCITGGEPTLQPDLAVFCSQIKERGRLVKVDTNGSRPEVVSDLIGQKLVDYWAMDIKTVFDGYDQAVGVGVDINKITESMRLIADSGVEYEFRTTVVPGIHSGRIMKKMAGEIASGKWYWQNFRGKNCWDEKLIGKSGFRLKEVEEWLKGIDREVGLRGW